MTSFHCVGWFESTNRTLPISQFDLSNRRVNSEGVNMLLTTTRFNHIRAEEVEFEIVVDDIKTSSSDTMIVSAPGKVSSESEVRKWCQSILP